MGGVSGGFPIDLILFGMIAAFLVLRLRSILGKRTGFERPPQTQQPVQPGNTAGATAEGPQATQAVTVARQLPDPASPTGQAIARMQGLDRSFDPTMFLAGAEQAFRMIVTAFASGDRQTLRALLSDESYSAFEQAITARETAGHTQSTEIRAIQSSLIEAAEVKGTSGVVTVRIVSDQVSFTHDKDGNPLVGTEAVTEITDLWTFERDLTSQDPTWRLVAARSA